MIVFSGPSLQTADRRRFPGVDWRPPAEAGDLLGLDVGPGDTVCLIDGWFDHRPSVRHKELLALLARGTRVFGAASLGALRAAEMDGLGLVGVGAVYRAFAARRLVGDDEVALVHGPESWDWRPLSVPLVDLRATLCRAARDRVLAPPSLRALLEAAKASFYADRDWPRLVEAVLTRAEAQAFGSWLSGRAVERKRLDALACLEAAARPHPAIRRPPEVRTVFVEQLARRRFSPPVQR